jgi:hypothetical protein
MVEEICHSTGRLSFRCMENCVSVSRVFMID